MPKNLTINNLLIRTVIVFVALLAGYVLFGVVSCLLPNGPIHKHIEQSVNHGDLESDYPRAIIPRKQAEMDNFTDALILDQAWYCSADSLWHSVMAPSRARGKEMMVDLLRETVEGQAESTIQYPRYWHGSTFLMRWLLLFWPYMTIRMIFYLLSTVLLLWVSLVVGQRVGWWASLLMVLSMAIMYLYVMQFSIQFLPVVVLALVGVLGVCRNSASVAMQFFVVGSLTAYFDLLTIPLLTLGMPLIFYILLQKEEERMSLRTVRIVTVSIVWFLGFSLTWGAKWLLASATTSMNVLHDAVVQAGYRTGGLDDFSRWDAVSANAGMVHWFFVTIVMVVLLFLMLRHRNFRGWQTTVLLLVVAFIPYICYIILANHSYLHWWFTYRLQTVTLLSLFIGAGHLINWNAYHAKN